MECWLKKPVLCVCEGEGDAKAPLLSTRLEPASKSSPKLEGWAEQPEEQMVLISEFTVFPPLSPPPADI